MHFESVHILHFLWLLPVLAGILHVLFDRRQRITAKFVKLNLLPQEDTSLSLRRWRIKAILVTVFYAFAIIALARPQWGYQMQEVKRQGLDILIAVDTSKSMLTQDVKPSRLERTKLAIKDLVKQLKGDRVGLIAFAGESFLVCPLTIDYSGFMLSLNDLNAGTIPRGGTDLSKAIDEAVKGYGRTQQPYKTLILVTDGEDQEGDAQAAAQRARAKGIKIYTVGIGTQEGDLIRIVDDKGQESFLKDANGNVVKSKLNENLLQQIAYITGGAYVRSSGAQFGLDYLYSRQLANLEKHEIGNTMEKKYNEHYQWFIALALLALAGEALINTGRK